MPRRRNAVRRIACCRTCRGRFTTKSGSKLCLSCRPGEAAPEVTDGGVAAAIDLDVDTRDAAGNGETIRHDGVSAGGRLATAQSKQAVDVVSIGSDSDADGGGDGGNRSTTPDEDGSDELTCDNNEDECEDEHHQAPFDDGPIDAEARGTAVGDATLGDGTSEIAAEAIDRTKASSNSDADVVIDLSEMDDGEDRIEENTAIQMYEGDEGRSPPSSPASSASSSIPSPWKAVEDVGSGLRHLSVSRPTPSEADAKEEEEGKQLLSSVNIVEGSDIGPEQLSDEVSVLSFGQYRWDEDQPVFTTQQSKQATTAPAVEAIDISDHSVESSVQSVGDASSVSSDDSIWNKQGFESKRMEIMAGDDPSSCDAPPDKPKLASKSNDDTASKHFHCYLLRSLDPKHPLKTYIGFTTHPQRRIRQHNGILKSGGARRTKRSGRPWTFVCVIHGFEDKIAALQFEWAWQNVDKSKSFREAVGCDALARKMKRRHGPKARLDELRILLKECLPFSLYALTVYFPEREYHDVFAGMLRRGTNGNPYKRDEGESDAYESLMDIQVCPLEKMPAAREEAALKERKKKEREAKKAQKKPNHKKPVNEVRIPDLPASVEPAAVEENWFDVIDDDADSRRRNLDIIEEKNSSIDLCSIGAASSLKEPEIGRMDGLREDFLGLSIDRSPKKQEEMPTSEASDRVNRFLSSADSSILEVGIEPSFHEAAPTQYSFDDGSVSSFGSLHSEKDPQGTYHLDAGSVSSVSSFGSLLVDTNPPASRQRKLAAPVEGADDLDAIEGNWSSSASSEDSIWDKKGFEAKQRIESYYDYLQFQSVSARDAPAVTCGQNTPIDGEDGSESEHLPPEVPLPTDATWRIILLMDHREFGCANSFLQTVEQKMNEHFGRKCAEITTLASADYLYVARLFSHDTGEMLDERVLDMVIERKAVQDACQCLIADSKKYKPLSFFEAQMYKMQHSGVTKKLFLMEGDEHKVKNLFQGCKSQKEKDIRLKRVKTLRVQLANGEFEGVDLICTRNKWDTIKFLIHQLNVFQQSFNPRRPPTKTRGELKNYINRQMKAPTFLEYLRLRSIPGIGDVKAMKVITNPKLDWDKSFISPSSSKKSKATLEDRATFWKAPSGTAYIFGKSSKPSGGRTKSNSQPKPAKSRSKKTAAKKGAHKSTELQTWLDGRNDEKENSGNAIVEIG